MSRRKTAKKANDEKTANAFSSSKLRETLDDDFKSHCKAGTSALIAADKARLSVTDGKVTASIDVDGLMKKAEPNSNRWDYLIEYCDKVYAIEVHGCTEGEVDKVVKKAEWIRQWINRQPNLKKIVYKADIAVCFWLSSNTTNISPLSPKGRILATKKIILCGRVCDFKKHVV